MKKYEHLIFDLDHTLWDFERNSASALEEIYFELKLKERGIPTFKPFFEEYKRINEECWTDYRNGKLEKKILRTIRFKRTLATYSIDDESLSEAICESYLLKSPRKPHLIEGAVEILDYLQRKYELHILTNGFAEIQEVKMEASGLHKYFKHVIASENAGAKKPHYQAFTFAVEQIGTSINECIMIGDNPETDIEGAKNIGMDTVYFNRNGAFSREVEATHQIFHLKELLPIL
jgi:putative hydrolase of the HAD superfamily